MNIKNRVIEANPHFLIFFDNVRVDKFVKDYNVSLNNNGSIGVATINMVYVPDLDKIIHDDNKEFNQNINDSSQSNPKPQQNTPSKSTTTTGIVVGIYSGSRLNVRSGPGTNYKITGKLYNGNKVTITGTKGAWYNVKLSNGQVGWCHSDYIQKSTPPAPSQNNGSHKTGMIKGINSGSYLNVRSGPGVNYSIIGRLNNGASVTVISTKNNWHNINYNSKTAWVSGDYVNITSSSSSSSSNKNESGVNIISDDGIENMTNVRIFVKNVYSGNYVEIYGGNVRSKSISMSSGQYTLSFQAEDYLNWLNRTICPIAVPFDGTLTSGDRLKWKAQGIDINKVQSVNTIKDITFKGKNISETWKTISDQTIKANKLYSASDSVSSWDDPISKVVIMGDIDEKLKKAEIMDFMITSSATSVNTIYVMMNDILKTLMFEFYQDRDETIRIKPPFWNEHVLQNHVIDPSIILNYAESTNYNSYYTRVLAVGALENWMEENVSDELTKSMLTPVVAVTSGGVTANSGPVMVTSQVGEKSYSGSSSAGDKVVSIARQQIGIPYVWGGQTPQQGFDCSGLVIYCYKLAGYPFSQRETTTTLIKKGKKVSRDELIPGDLVFPDSGHVTIYSGGGKCIHAPQPGDKVKESNIWKFWDAVRILPENGSGAKYEKPVSVGPDSLLEPTFMERKYGPLVYDVSQPLIKFSTSGTVDNSANAYEALSKYARFMINYLNSNTSLASVNTLSMPWIRPGFNVWVDPVRVDKVFYVNSVSHYGNGQGNYTSLSLSLGRHRASFVSNPNMIGGLKPGKSDDIFVNTLMVKPENFGKVCDYNDVKQRSNKFHLSDETDNFEYVKSSSNDYLQYLYGSSVSNKFDNSSSSSSQNNSTQSSIVQGEVTGIYSNSHLNIRSGPSLQNKVIGSLKNGVRVEIISQTNNWYKIKNNNSDGWVSTQYVKKIGISPNSQAKQSTSTGTIKGINSGSYLNVRSGPGTNYKSIGKLYNNNNVSVVEQKSGWVKIKFNNKDAWVSSKYITVSTTSSPSPSTSNPSTTNNNNYSSHSSTAKFPDEYSIDDIQNKLNLMYSQAPSVVKQRSERLSKLIKNSEQMLDLLYINH